MKKYVKKLTAIFATVALFASALTLTGCDGTSEINDTPISIVIVTAEIANSASPDFGNNQLNSLFRDVVLSGGTVSLVVPDGDARRARVMGEYERVADKQRDENYMTSTGIDDLTATIAENAIAQVSEVNLLGGIAEASRWLRGQPDDHRKQLVVMHSGITTVAPLDLQSLMLGGIANGQLDTNNQIEGIISRLSENHNLPKDLSFGFDALWLGMGEVHDNQEQPHYRQIEWLENLWSGIFEARDGPSINFQNMDIVDSDNRDGLPSVTSVSMRSGEPSSLIDVEFVPIEIDEEETFADGLDLSEQLIFNGSCDTFRFPDLANEVLDDIATSLRANPRTTLLIYGGVARLPVDLERAPAIGLSQRRADRARNGLIDRGIDPDRIVAIGTGWENPRFSSGTTDEDHNNNRLIVAVCITSDEAQEILAMHPQP